MFSFQTNVPIKNVRFFNYFSTDEHVEGNLIIRLFYKHGGSRNLVIYNLIGFTLHSFISIRVKCSIFISAHIKAATGWCWLTMQLRNFLNVCSSIDVQFNKKINSHSSFVDNLVDWTLQIVLTFSLFHACTGLFKSRRHQSEQSWSSTSRSLVYNSILS